MNYSYRTDLKTISKHPKIFASSKEAVDTTESKYGQQMTKTDLIIKTKKSMILYWTYLSFRNTYKVWLWKIRCMYLTKGTQEIEFVSIFITFNDIVSQKRVMSNETSTLSRNEILSNSYIWLSL